MKARRCSGLWRAIIVRMSTANVPKEYEARVVPCPWKVRATRGLIIPRARFTAKPGGNHSNLLSVSALTYRWHGRCREPSRTRGVTKGKSGQALGLWLGGCFGGGAARDLKSWRGSFWGNGANIATQSKGNNCGPLVVSCRVWGSPQECQRSAFSFSVRQTSVYRSLRGRSPTVREGSSFGLGALGLRL